MRLETTLPEIRREQLRMLQAELKLTKSQVIDEALSIFIQAHMETKRGNRLAIIDADGRQTGEVASLALSQIEWAAFSKRLNLSTTAVRKIRRMTKHPMRRRPHSRRPWLDQVADEEREVVKTRTTRKKNNAVTEGSGNIFADTGRARAGTGHHEGQARLQNCRGHRGRASHPHGSG